MDNHKYRINVISNHFNYFKVPKVTDELIYFEIKNNILTIKINNLKNQNKLNNDMIKKINDILKSYEDDESINCFMITGNGDCFCCGIEPNTEFNIDIKKYDKPIIAAINGQCNDEGFQVALMCDMVIASDTSLFDISNIKDHFTSSHKISKLNSFKFNSIDALNIKVINKVTSKDSLMEYCFNIASNIGKLYSS